MVEVVDTVLEYCDFAAEKSITEETNDQSPDQRVAVRANRHTYISGSFIYVSTPRAARQNIKSFSRFRLYLAIFIAHPLHVEVVANVKGRDEHSYY
jgi:hypothetical protein